jgi:HAD superfamily hydrolase (TIGR01509 family)
MTIRALIFDIGGVLIRSVDKGRRGFWEGRLGVSGNQIAEALWLSPTGRNAMAGKASEADAWTEVGRRFSLERNELLRLEDDFRAESTLEIDLLNFVRSLRPHYKLGIISDAFLSARSRIESVFPAGIFDVMVFSAEEGVTKPDPVIFHRALERLGVPAEQALFIDDLPHNVAAARSLGMMAIQCQNSRQVQQDILKILAGQVPQG